MVEQDRVTQRLDQVQPLGQRICLAMREVLQSTGLPTVAALDAGMTAARYELSQDVYSHEETLIGAWRDGRGMKQGEMLFHGDGTFYAEFDVVQPHPTDHRWFVEAVTAWGRGEDIKTELRLLPALS